MGWCEPAGETLRTSGHLSTWDGWQMRKHFSTILLLAGSAALLWCATVWTGAALFQKYQARRWNPPAAVTEPVSAASSDLVDRPAPAPPAPKLHDVIAWIEIPR